MLVHLLSVDISRLLICSYSIYSDFRYDTVGEFCHVLYIKLQLKIFIP